MRLAVLSDIHGNLTALEAVVADIDRQSPDLVLHGGDLALIGPRPAEVIDRLRELQWSGVLGNTDEVLFDDSVQDEQERRAPGLVDWLRVLFGSLTPWARDRVGDERAAWLRTLPTETRRDDVLLIHAAPGDLWRAPMPDATDRELLETYGGCDANLVVYGHIHRPYVRSLPAVTVANGGSVGLPYDGDPRSSYLLIEDGGPSIRRVEYDIERACHDARDAEFPLADWLAGVLRTGRFTQP
jgi:putative phosphoesterase